jgi:two-component system cell cycle sensor histidine kinase/response regulator CckA
MAKDLPLSELESTITHLFGSGVALSSHRVYPLILKTLPSVRLAIVLALVFTSAIVVRISRWDVFWSRAPQAKTEAPLLNTWQHKSAPPSTQALDSTLFIPRGLAQLMRNLGVTPVQGVTVALGAILVLLVLAGVSLHRAAESSRKSEERFARIFQSSPLAFTITTRKEGRYVDVNDAFLQMLRYERKEIMGRSSLDLNVWVDPEDRTRMLQVRESSASNGLRTRMRTSRGEVRHVKVWSELIEFDGVPCVLAITQDVTETQHLEDQFRQAHKMEALGCLAAGVAHDFNNLLSVTMGYSELSLQQMDPSHPLARNLREIKMAAERAVSLTRRLLGFSRQQILFMRILDLNAVLDNLHQMLLRMIGEDIALVFKPGIGLGRIKADLGQIEQVLMNLIVNARDAMPKGGTIIIETSNVELDDGYVDSYFSVPRGRYTLLSVSDSGSGMDEKTLSRIFEPFFTTKAPGQGSGLGLSTVYGIVKQSEGHIWVYSEPSRGTTFKMYFPRREEIAEPVLQSTPEAEPSGGVETILVVEDDASLRKMVVTLLASTGYKVLEAGTAEAAVRMVRSLNGPVDLLLTDVLLPDLNGVELSALLKTIQPGLRVLLISGYTRDLIAQYEAIDPKLKLMEKPFTRRALLATIYDVLHNG